MEFKIIPLNIQKYFPPYEGSINQYYGRIRQGKTYAAVCDILEDLKRGQVVYANFKIDWKGIDEYDSWIKRFLYKIGLKKYFIEIPKQNFHFLPIDEKFEKTFESLTSCSVYLDEGHIAFDSYVKTNMQLTRRVAVLNTGHFDRTINIISQRPTAIHVTLRANVNRFFKCEKVFDMFGLRLFRRSEYQDMTNETVDEEKEPIEVKYYWGKKRIYNAYNTKWMRGDVKESQNNAIMAKIPLPSPGSRAGALGLAKPALVPQRTEAYKHSEF